MWLAVSFSTNEAYHSLDGCRASSRRRNVKRGNRFERIEIFDASVMKYYDDEKRKGVPVLAFVIVSSQQKELARKSERERCSIYDPRQGCVVRHSVRITKMKTRPLVYVLYIKTWI